MKTATDDEKKVVKYPPARLAGMKEFMTFLREPDWRPAKINADLLKMLEMSKGRETEAVSALRFLGIIDEDVKPTEKFDLLKENYQEVLKGIVYDKYSDLFSLLPVRMINQNRLVKFFGTTTETAEYQAKFFVWLCEESGIVLPNIEKRFHRARFNKKRKQSSHP